MKRVFLFLVICISIFAHSSLFAQPQNDSEKYISNFSGKISGKIVNERGEPLPGANIKILDTYLGVVSNSDGRFEFNNLKSSKYTFCISFIGYETLIQETEIEQDKEKIFILKASDVLADEVIVSVTRANNKQPISFTSINKDELQKNNFGQDVPYLLSLTPSLVTSSDAGTGVGYTYLRIRGTDANRINVTVNGIPFNDSESHSVYWVDLPDFTSSVDNIQIQRGVGTSTNGAAAFGATINLQTAVINKNAFAEWNTAYGSFNTQKYCLTAGSGLIHDRFTFDIRLSKVLSDGYIDRASSNLQSYFISAAYYDSKSLLRFNIFSGVEETYQAWLGVPKDSLETNRTFNPYSYENEIDHYLQTHYQLMYSRSLGKYLTFNSSIHYTHGNGYYEQYREADKFSKYGLSNLTIGNTTISKTDLIRRKWLENDFYGFTYSLNYRQSKLDISLGGGWNQYLGNHFGKIIWAQFASGIPKDYQWYDSDGNKIDFNIFAKINYQLFSKVNIYADFQYRNIQYEIFGNHDYFDDNGLPHGISQFHLYDFINPKFGIMFDISSAQKLYFSFATANREPNRSNLIDADAGKTPTFETLHNYEFGYKIQQQNMLAEVNYFYMDYKNQLVLTGEINNVGDAIMVNVPSSYRTGVEISLAGKVLEFIHLRGNLAISQNKINEFTEYVDDWDTWSQRSNVLSKTDLSFSPNVVAGGEIRVEPIKNLDIAIQSKYVGKQYIDNTSSEDRKLDAYWVNDFKIGYRFTTKLLKEISIHGSINNVLNEKYETNAWVYRYYENNTHGVSDGYFPQAGRNFMVGLNVKF